MIKVVIVDDDTDAANALKRNIDGQDDISVTAVMSSGEEAVERCAEFMPDVILMDVKMPGMGGINAGRIIKEKFNDKIKVLILTLFQSDQNEVNALRDGCDGYLYKGKDSKSIITYIKSAYNNMVVWEKNVQNSVSEKIKSQEPDKEILRQLDMMKDREKAMIRLVTAGKSDKEIAKELYLAEGYVRNELSRIREVLCLSNSRELAVWGAKAGL